VLKDFKQFILRGNVIDLAVAVAIGASFTAVVNSLVKDLINPLISIIGGQPNLNKYSITINHNAFNYGDFISTIITFLITASVVFFLVVQPINHLQNMVKGPQSIEADTKECSECLSEIPKAAKRCKYCGVLVSSKK
jgi:large conductance mechanosensitive channel